MKRFFAGAMLLLILATSALAIPAPTREFYASDDAGVMSSATRDYIVSHGKAIAKDNGAQVVVATVKSLEGQDIRDYGHELARSWGIGSGEKDNGVLILFALDERKIALEVGRSLEGALNDGKVGRLIDECAVPDFKNDNFDAGIMKLYQGTVAEIYKEYGGTIPSDVTEADTDWHGPPIWVIIVGILVVGFLIVMAVRGNGSAQNVLSFILGMLLSGRGGGGGDGDGDGGSFGGGGDFGGGGASRGF